MPQSILTSSLVARVSRAAAAVLVAVACAGVARAQAPAPSKEAAPRERRATAAPKEAPAAKDEDGKAAGETVWSGNLNTGAGGEAKGAEGGATAGVGAGADKDEAAKDEAAPAASGEASVEELRARIEEEKDKAARARMQRELVERLTAEGRTAEAVASLRAMLAEERFDPPFFYNVGNQLARLGESGPAVEAYRKAVAQRRGGYSRAQHNLGVVLIRLGRWQEAEEALTAALRLESFNYAEASYNLGRLHALRGEAGFAIREWARTLRLKPDHAPAAAALARALAEDGDPKEALAVLDAFSARLTRRGLTVPPEVAAARAEIASAAPEEPAKPAGGAPAAERVSRAGRGSLRPLVVRGETYELLRRARSAREAERLGEAVKLYREAIESNGGYFAPANLELGFALSGLRRTDEAIEELRAVVSRSASRYPIALYHLGRLYEHAGRFAEAADAYAQVAGLMGDTDPQFFADLSRAREKEGKTAEALAAMEGYVRASERLGDVPAWARQRLASLRQKETPAPPAAVKK